MTGTFSIKRRKQDTPRPNGQSSQSSVLSALGLMIGRSSPHAASQRGHIHVADLAADGTIAFAKAQEWHAQTGRPLPPHMKVRRPVTPASPLGVHGRAARYSRATDEPSYRKLAARSTQAVLDDPAWTTPRRRRLIHKAGAHGDVPAGYVPAARLAVRPRAPRTPAQRKRAAKNAAQQARHLARLP